MKRGLGRSSAVEADTVLVEIDRNTAGEEKLFRHAGLQAPGVSCTSVEKCVEGVGQIPRGGADGSHLRAFE